MTPLGLYGDSGGEASSRLEVGRRSVGISTTASPSMCAECMSSDKTADHLRPVHDKEETDKRRCRGVGEDGRRSWLNRRGLLAPIYGISYDRKAKITIPESK